MALLTQVLAQATLNGQLKQIRDLDIEIDQAVLNLNFALSFDNCKFKFLQNSQISNFLIYTDQGIRFENCEIAAAICIWGENGNSGLEVLEKKGPNVFFDNCNWLKFTSSTPYNTYVENSPQLQVSGYINHFRSSPSLESIKSRLTISQCRFDKVEVIGLYTMFQIVEFSGNELILKDVNPDYIWIREDMTSFIKYIDIDNCSAKSICESFLSRPILSQHDLNVVKNFMHVYFNKKEGRKFLQMNSAYCVRAPIIDVQSFLSLRVFRNFYSFKPWIYIFIGTVLTFFLIYLFFNFDILRAMLSSLYAISGNPELNDKLPILSLLQAIEAFIGLFFVIIFSWILTRKYSNYI